MVKWCKTTMIPTEEHKLAVAVEKIERGMRSSVEGSREVGDGLALIRDSYSVPRDASDVPSILP